ncbi:LytR family transcriptional regulator [Candidatus Parcubacteria bacterium]|nr:MAG: LytR family transcriptional regulator [Candidatus Parcubacteria bacterium]
MINREENFDTFQYLKIFLLIVLFSILFSLVYKGVKLVTESKFWGSYYNLLVVTPDDYFLLQINNSSGKATLMEAVGLKRKKNDSRFEICMEIGVPCDGLLVYTNARDAKGFENIVTFTSVVNMIFSKKNYQLENMNTLDLVKVYFYLKSVSDNNFYRFKYDFRKSESLKMYDLFKNDLIINDKLSLEIINSTSINGLGTNFSEMLKSAGYSVVFVSSSEEKSLSKIIYRVDGNSVTLKYLRNFLNIPGEYKNESSIADITVILGNDLFSEANEN